MPSSFYSALSGMRSHQQWIDVIGNNLANQNTPGYKKSRAVFADNFAQNFRFASGPRSGVGGITEDEVMQIAKSFRELEAPFYVHCFHGRHRGPAAAAIGRVALDGLERGVAIAEMRQWCSTAAKYEGLYSTVATATIPSAEQTAAYDFDFAPARHAVGMREGMIVMTRVWDEVKLVEANGWQPDEEHPDIDPLRSATIFAQLLRACDEAERPRGAGEDFEEMMAAGLDGADRLVELLTDCRVEGVAPDERLERLEAAFDVVSESCLDCHVDYRNRPR